jgi:hypothetical protein
MMVLYNRLEFRHRYVILGTGTSKLAVAHFFFSSRDIMLESIQGRNSYFKWYHTKCHQELSRPEAIARVYFPDQQTKSHEARTPPASRS